MAMPVHEAWVLGALIMLIGLVGGWWLRMWWMRAELDETWDRAVEWGYDHCGDGGVTGVFVCSLFRGHDGPHEDRSDNGTVSWDDLGQSHGRTAAGSAEQEAPTGREGTEADELPPLAAGHTIYTELTALDVQDIADEVAEAEAAVDPDWHPAFLARSDAWLAEWRANLGLEEAA